MTDAQYLCNMQANYNHEGEEWKSGGQWGTFINDRTGKVLETQAVRAARQKEVRTLEEMQAYEKVPRHVMKARGGKTVQTRWLDVDKSLEAQSCCGRGVAIDMKKKQVHCQ